MPFEKDLGYLAHFLDKLEAHAETLPTQTQVQLRSFLNEERARWHVIRESVLAADQSSAATLPTEASADIAPESELDFVCEASSGSARSARDADPERMPIPQQTASAQPAPPPPTNLLGSRLTVGSLIRT